MPSFVWDRRTDEAYLEPYEYGGQEQFSREAKRVLKHLKEHYSKRNLTFTLEDKSAEKTVWMLQVDGLEALCDALLMTDEKKHRIASRLFRDAVETLDMSAYFYLAGKGGQRDLAKWYENEVIPHRRFREFIKKSHGKEEAGNLSSLYCDLSKYTHRTYKSISTSYSLWRHDLLVYDGFRESDILVLPHTFLGAGVKTVVLFFEKGAPTRNIWFYQLDPGRSMGKTNPLNDNDLKDFVARQGGFDDSVNSWTVDGEDKAAASHFLKEEEVA